jgi:protein-tyrosine phosphatase
VTNARDLGGVPLDQGAVACRSLFRGPPLYALSSAGCDQVASLGIKTVIDLRQSFERDSKPTSDCVGADQVFAPLPIPYELSAQNYLAVLDAPVVAQIFHTFADPDAYPIYFHCTWGRDRTGVIGALLLLALGASREDVLTEYLLSKDSVGAYPDSLVAVLDEIDARGGAEAFLVEIGLSQDEISALRERALAPQN